MRKSILLSGLFSLALGILPSSGAPVQIKMNYTSETMTLSSEDGSAVNIGEPTNRSYQFDVAPGNYLLTAFEADGTANGTIVVKVEDKTELQAFDVFTHALYATNTTVNGELWQYGVDYSANVEVFSREGEKQTVTIGDSSNEGRKSVLSFSGNTVYLTLIPSDTHSAEGYMPLSSSGTVTFNMNLSGEIPMGCDYTIKLPKDAYVQVGQKKSHFTEFSIFEPVRTEVDGESQSIIYRLPSNQKFNLRTWKTDGLTQALYFTPRESGEIAFTSEDYMSYNPKQVNHNVNSNEGYETGDIFVNINEHGHLVMNVGDTYDAHAMRTWQLTDTQIDNYFFEPDFHYTVIGLDGQPSTGVIEVSTDNTTSPWRTIKAVGNGTAIILVTYDAIKVSRPDESQKWMGGEYWGAIWPENTAAYVVTVGENSNSIKPNMVVNEQYNIGEDGKTLLKLAGKKVDAEHGVFYYLDTENGFNYTFKPEGVVAVSLAYPTIGENAATYTGFGMEGVTNNEDGSYTVLLKHGRTIVRLTDSSGKSVYQVMTAKSCHRDITNETRSGSDSFYPGDKVKIQYSGLFHPANKLAGIYNMSAYVTYNGNPNGTSLILGPGQYTFGSAPKAQAIEFEIPANYDVDTNPEFILNDGVLQVTGYGDPIGNHRNIDKTVGRSPNFTAVAHKTYFGSVPDVKIPVNKLKTFKFNYECNAENAEVTISKDNVVLAPDGDGYFTGVSGIYSIEASAPGYRYLRTTYEITNEMPETLSIPVNLYYSPNAWDGESYVEPALKDGVYQISSGAELAWFANYVNNSGTNQKAELTNNIDLGNYPWTPIGQNMGFFGQFSGNGYKVEALYANSAWDMWYGLFSMVNGTNEAPARIEDLAVYGEVTASLFVGGISGSSDNAEFLRCANFVNVTGESNVGGIVGAPTQTVTITDCANYGNIKATMGYVGGIAGENIEGITVSNVLNTGSIISEISYGPCISAPYTTSYGAVSNMFGIENVELDWIDGQTACDGSEIVSKDRLSSGEIAHHLGSKFGQTLGIDSYPLLNGDKVYKVNYNIISPDNGNLVTQSDTDNELYTNSVLPKELNGEEVHWYEDADMTMPISSIDTDRTLYVILGTLSSIDSILTDQNNNVRWYNIQGVEVPIPNIGTHGIFIRVVNGKSEKVVL